MRQPAGINREMDGGPRFRLYSRISALFSMLVGGMVLAGWAANLDALKRVVPGSPQMSADSALCFLLAGLALMLLLPERPVPLLSGIGYGAALAAMLLGAATFVEYAFGLDFNLDGVLLSAIPASAFDPNAVRMAPNAALSFLLIGLGMLLINWETSQGERPFQLFAIGGVFLGLQDLVVYCYGMAPVATMSLHGATTSTVLLVGLALSRPESGMMKILTGEGAVSAMARRLILPAVVVLPALGAVKVIGVRRASWELEFALTILVVAVLVVFFRQTSFSFGAVSSERALAEARLQASEQRCHSLIENARDLIFTLDSEGNFTSINRAAEELTGYTRQEAARMNV